MFSMTGYGKAVKEEEGRKLSVELKAVNHRFLDLNIKMPRILNPCEDAVRKIISENVSRGHIDVYLNYSDNSDKLKQVRVDIGLADGYLKAAAELEDKFFYRQQFFACRTYENARRTENRSRGRGRNFADAHCFGSRQVRLR